MQLTFDAADPDRLADFWAEMLGYIKQPPPEGFDDWQAWAASMGIPEENWGDASAIIDPEGKRPRIFFQKVPEPKTAKNRMHLDVPIGVKRGADPAIRRAAQDAAVAKAIAAGATELARKAEFGTDWVVMADPEGNEFCLI
jgi:hypothetical protein